MLSSPINGHLKTRSGYIPVELLSEIFRHCLPTEGVGHSTPNPLNAPLLLSSVCRSWRDIALSTHGLWTDIFLAHMPDKIENGMRLLELWISRSGALPMDIQLAFGSAHFNSENLNPDPDPDSESDLSTAIDAPMLLKDANYDDPSFQEKFKVLIKTICSLHKRWGVLQIISPTLPFIQPIINLLPHASNLQDFCISSRELRFSGDNFEVGFPLNSPLQKLRLIAPHAAPSKSSLTEHRLLSNLRTLELHFCSSLQTCLDWIDLCPDIENLLVRFFFTEDQDIVDSIDPQASRRIRRLPNLASIELTCFTRGSNQSDPAKLLDLLDLPNLDVLELDLNHHYDPFRDRNQDQDQNPGGVEQGSSSWTHISRLLERSGTDLWGLILHGIPITYSELLLCLQLSPRLEYLGCDSVSEAVLQALSPKLIMPSGVSGSTSTGSSTNIPNSTANMKNNNHSNNNNNTDNNNSITQEATIPNNDKQSNESNESSDRKSIITNTSRPANKKREELSASMGSELKDDSSNPNPNPSPTPVTNPTSCSCSCSTSTPTPPSDQEPETETETYTLLCPNLKFFELTSINHCPLQLLYEFTRSRCEDGVCDMSDFNAVLKEPEEKTPERFKTISALVFPMDEDDGEEGEGEGENGGENGGEGENEGESEGRERVGNGNEDGDGDGDGNEVGVGVGNEEGTPVVDRMEASED
ncbi:hypothetical protein PNOK_0868400 [Pyrrhoderma noxium]|uniref:F-box domain-containing protein n=1 Tax=Pyrrhoderma noxium TaxID=2282107 RepID=A0A286U8D7_9AGAM|nr:hypothetical protein PNOK_0868400 [Pyrrhoderma noxium]